MKRIIKLKPLIAGKPSEITSLHFRLDYLPIAVFFCKRGILCSPKMADFLWSVFSQIHGAALIKVDDYSLASFYGWVNSGFDHEACP